jgi:hypothetical protein
LPNKLPQPGHAMDGFSCFSASARVSRMLSVLFGDGDRAVERGVNIRRCRRTGVFVLNPEGTFRG